MKPFQFNINQSTPEEIQQRKWELIEHMPSVWKKEMAACDIFPFDTVKYTFDSYTIGKVVAMRFYMPKYTRRIGVRFLDDVEELRWMRDNELEVIFRPSYETLKSLYGENDEES